MPRILCVAWFLLLAVSADAATVLYCPFDSLAGWKIRSAGACRAGLLERGEDDRCLEVQAEMGTVLAARELPLDDVRGTRLSVSCSVETDRVARGVQQSSTAKIVLAVQTPDGVAHHAARLTGTQAWHTEGFTVEIPEEATRVVLCLGLEGCRGLARFDRLLLRNDRPGVYPLDLTGAVNATNQQLGVDAFPESTIDWQGIPFHIIDLADNRAGNCLRLKGTDHPDWPVQTAQPIPVGRRATAIYLLHAVLGPDRENSSACQMWTAKMVDGTESNLSVFEANEIGSIERHEDFPNWKIAWQGTTDDDRTITFGVTRWQLFGDMPVESISCRAGGGSAGVILAITAVDEPPPPVDPNEPDPAEDDFFNAGLRDTAYPRGTAYLLAVVESEPIATPITANK